MLAALSIFVLTLVLVIWQPRGLGIGYSALGGAALALATGVIHVSDIPTVWHIIWDATFTFVGLIVISLILDEAGFFHWAALHVARLGGGRGRLLFPLVIVLGAVISALFANDGAALILTPIVLSMLLALGLTPQAALAFVMACGFVADTTSLPLVISNLVNIVTAEYFRIPFDRYAAVMLPVDLVALAATLLVLAVYFRRDVPRHYAVDKLPPPRSAVKDAVVFRWAFPTLGVLLLAYFVTAAYAVPVSVVTGLAAVLMLALAGRWWPGAGAARIDVRGVLRHAPWQIVLFSLGMYLVIYGLRNAGLTAELAHVLELLGRHGVVASAVGTGFISALLSSVMNNLPMTLIGALGIHQAQGLAPEVRETMIYAHVIGCDLGPKFTPIGSLATLLWLHVLERKGMRIGWGYYLRAGVVLTTPVLLLTLLALALRLG
ncbi:arsenic transporter [Thiomonas sp.]|jgi:arsenical pump membrane protein|uniref:arsenic transporter n=1 Tax=Thiomonas sp. TaxID=2047785 RepID=UPI0026354ED9|nr:arsenic transporter [Thiomonas sp.]